MRKKWFKNFDLKIEFLILECFQVAQFYLLSLVTSSGILAFAFASSQKPKRIFPAEFWCVVCRLGFGLSFIYLFVYIIVRGFRIRQRYRYFFDNYKRQ